MTIVAVPGCSSDDVVDVTTFHNDRQAQIGAAMAAHPQAVVDIIKQAAEQAQP